MTELCYDHTGFATAADGTRLFWGMRGEGEAPPVVLCDGIGCDGFVWAYLQPHLATRGPVLHWHYRGHGRSGPPRDMAALGIPGLAEDLWRVCDAAEIDRAVLLGHSMGVQVALEALRHASRRVLGLGLLCGSAGRITQTFHGTDLLDQWLPRIVAWVERHLTAARALWGRVSPRLAYRVAAAAGEVDGLSIREEDFHRYWEHVSLMDPDVFLRLLRAAGAHSAEDILPHIEVPTLVAAAERDTFTPPELARRMAEQIPNAVFHEIHRGSHAAPVEQPTLVERWVDELLASVAARSDRGSSRLEATQTSSRKSC